MELAHSWREVGPEHCLAADVFPSLHVEWRRGVRRIWRMRVPVRCAPAQPRFASRTDDGPYRRPLVRWGLRAWHCGGGNGP